MIRIVGPDWPSTRALRAKVEELSGGRGDLTFAWGSPPRRLNSIEQLTAIRQAGVCTPDFTTDIRIAREWVLEAVLVFGRRFLHTQGRDIVGPRHRRWARSDWWSRVVPVVDEWRIHIFDGKSIARGKKVQTSEAWRRMPVRNRKNGWTMIHTEKPTDAIREAARQAVAACGYEYGAVDVYTLGDGGVGVFEVNTCPGLDDYTCLAYARAVCRKAGVNL